MSTLERLVLFLVWLALTASGAWFFLNLGHTAKSTDNERAVITAGLFIAMTTAVCTIGGFAYANQNTRFSGGTIRTSERYVPALKTSLVWQLVVLTFSALVLDTGQAKHIAVVAVAAYWPMIFLIVLRRMHAPTRLDLIAIRHGYSFVLLAVAIAEPSVWARMGHAL